MDKIGDAYMKKRIFVSHPYSGNPEDNMKSVETVCKSIWENGYLPISPLHLFSFMDNDNDRYDILTMCFRLIDECDEVWIYGKSSGCDKEKEYAEIVGKKIIMVRGE